ncbi:hypothetical protein [Hymenobacter metallicola]|uniref:Uncharacterized protein n=1 Tax=Hymenobacter metallicola TaxID=2563114 RepID=A0A4Z0QDS3_9BACT|nr:hypothetical protein [Hymenobacter metallicola]TGE28207.1 hypothetical protein E5K02_01720 [Hymenobacter metallicola]
MYLRRITFWSTALSLSVLAACSSKENNNQAATKPAEPLAAVADTDAAPPPAADSGATAAVSLTDSTGLSPEFVRGLKDIAGAQKYTVSGKTLVMDAFGSADFPTDLPAGKAVTYSGQQGSQTFTLTVTRLNYTSIRFAAEMLGGKNGPQHEEGVADLNPGFIMAAEVPEDTESQTAYGASEYLHETPTRNFSILIGIGSDVDKAELGVYDATGKPVAQWQGVPTLRRLAL